MIANPYGGPHAQRVLEVARAYNEAQWIADQGFAVIIADGRVAQVEVRPGSERSNPTSLRFRSRTKLMHCMASRSFGQPTSTLIASESPAGPSADTSQHWPSCAAPTSFTRPSQAHR